VARRRRVTRDTRAYTHTRARARAAIEVWCGARAGIGFVLDWSSPDVGWCARHLCRRCIRVVASDGDARAGGGVTACGG